MIYFALRFSLYIFLVETGQIARPRVRIAIFNVNRLTANRDSLMIFHFAISRLLSFDSKIDGSNGRNQRTDDDLGIYSGFLGFNTETLLLSHPRSIHLVISVEVFLSPGTFEVLKRTGFL